MLGVVLLNVQNNYNFIESVVYGLTVCPMNLEPVFMYMYYSKGDYENLEKYHVMDCFECGSCSYNCPARMPLTHAFKTAKLMLQAKAAKEKAAAEAKEAKEGQK